MSQLKKLNEKRASVINTIEELRTAAEKREFTADEQTKWDKLFVEVDSIEKQIENEKRFMQLANEKRNNEEIEESPEKLASQEFRNYLMTGKNGNLEMRAVVQGMERTVIVPETLSTMVEVALKSYGGILQAGSMLITATGEDIKFPTLNQTDRRAKIISDYEEVSTDKFPFGSQTIKAYTYVTDLIPIAWNLLQDSAINVEQYIAQVLVDSFYRGLNEDLTLGDGENKPKGIVTAATACDTTATANAIKFDDILDLIKSVDQAYAKDGRFMFNRATQFALMKLKDNNGQYIWNQNTAAGVQPTIFGHNYVINEDMQGIGTGNASVLFGALDKYKIRQVKGYSVQRMEETFARIMAVGIFGYARFDGALLDAGTHPVKKLIHA